MSSVVFLQQQHVNDNIETYIDALCFTIATVTTTGFGDIVVSGTYGKVLSIIIMVFGVTLFFRLVKVLFVPRQLYSVCQRCGHDRHELHAHFCAQCGSKLRTQPLCTGSA
jgi:voltage-gated potassium channel